MEEEPSENKRFSIRGWEPRWGHIFMALFVIGLLVLTFVIVRRIKNETNNNCANSVMSVSSCQANSNKGKSNKSKSQTATNNSSKSKSSTKNKSTTTNKSSTPSTAAKPSTSSPAPSTSSTPSQTAANPATSQALANTGPGDVVSVFITTSALSAIGYNLYIRYKLAKSN